MASRLTGSARPAYGGAVAAAGLGVLALGLWFGGGGPRSAIPGLPSPGPVTLWGLPLVRLALDVSAAMTVGLLVAATLLTMGPTTGPTTGLGTGLGTGLDSGLDSGQGEAARTRIARGARWWAAAWALAAALTFALTLSDFLGVPVQEALASEVLVSFAVQIPQGRAYLLVAGLAAVIAVTCAALGRLPYARSIRVALLAVALFALLPPAYVGHSATAADHNLAVSSLMLHVAAVAVWAGGLAGLLLCLRAAPGPGLTPSLVVRRFSALALACFAAVAVSGGYNALIRLGSLPALWETRYGLLVLGKLAALAALAWFGARHRRRTIAALDEPPGGRPDAVPEDMPEDVPEDVPSGAAGGDTARRRRPFLRLAAGEVVVMAATFGLAVALSRTPPPETEEVYGQEGLLGYALPPFDPVNLLTQTRPDPLVLLPLAAAAIAYLAGVRRLARTGLPWPAGRTAVWLAGLVLLAYALAGGVAAYAPAMFSVVAVQYALAGVAAPALLASGAPLTLALMATSPDASAGASTAPAAGGTSRAPFGDLPRALESAPVFRLVTRPVVAVAVHAVPYLVLFPLGLFGVVQPDHAWRLATQAVLVVTGLVFFAVVAGADPLPHPVPLPTRLRLLGVGIAAHAACALYVLGGPALAVSWYGNLALPWGPDRDADQQLGAMLGLATSTAAMAALIVTLLVWRSAARRRVPVTG